ncbi:hypothetical protein BDW_05935 [Bdellovibrio bacteriovorus W]|nr:hypothetical protein BDW_05935 [Bdellovibrio bacteriovorus W]
MKNSLWGNLNLAIRYGLSFLATAFVAKEYGPEIFGIYQLAITYLGVLDLVTFLNPHHLRNYLVRHPEEEGAIVTIWKFHHWVISILMFLSVLYFWWKSEYALVYTMLVLSFARIFSRVWDYAQVIVDARLRSDLVQKIQIVSFGTFNTTRMILSALRVSPEILSSASIVQSAVLVWHQKRILRNSGGVKVARMSFALFLKLVKDGWLLCLMAFLVGIQSRIVSLILVERMTVSDYGNFQLIFRLIEPAITVGTVLFGVNYTILANTFANNKEVFLKRFFKVSLIAILGSVGCASILAFLPVDWWIHIFGEAYKDGLNSLWMGALVVISSAIFLMSVQVDIITGRYISACFKNIFVIGSYGFVFFFYLSEASIEIAMTLYSVVPIFVVFLFLPIDGANLKLFVKR